MTKDESELRELERFLAAVDEGLADSEAGRVIDDEELDRELEEWLGREEM